MQLIQHKVDQPVVQDHLQRLEILQPYQVVEYTPVVEQDHKHLRVEMQEFQVEVDKVYLTLQLLEMVLLIQVVADQVVGLQVMDLEVLG
tara:strand:- start:16 stop:282 length:267 start_codon:yes stop_codon:yes gene_type:complete